MRKILLILCIAFVVVCYGYPCFVLPIGTYKYTATTKIGDKEISTTTTYEFDFKGNAVIKNGDVETEYKYKLKGDEIILSLDEEFDDNDLKIQISSMYKLNGAINSIGMWITIGVGVLAFVLVITIPRKN